MAHEQAKEIRAFLLERYGPDFGSVGVGDDRTFVYAKRYIGQIRRVLTQKWPHRNIEVRRADFAASPGAPRGER